MVLTSRARARERVTNTIFRDTKLDPTHSELWRLTGRGSPAKPPGVQRELSRRPNVDSIQGPSRPRLATRRPYGAGEKKISEKTHNGPETDLIPCDEETAPSVC